MSDKKNASEKVCFYVMVVYGTTTREGFPPRSIGRYAIGDCDLSTAQKRAATQFEILLRHPADAALFGGYVLEREAVS